MLIVEAADGFTAQPVGVLVCEELIECAAQRSERSPHLHSFIIIYQRPLSQRFIVSPTDFSIFFPMNILQRCLIHLPLSPYAESSPPPKHRWTRFELLARFLPASERRAGWAAARGSEPFDRTARYQETRLDP